MTLKTELNVINRRNVVKFHPLYDGIIKEGEHYNRQGISYRRRQGQSITWRKGQKWIHHCTVQYSNVQYNTVTYNIQCFVQNTEQWSTIQYSMYSTEERTNNDRIVQYST